MSAAAQSSAARNLRELVELKFDLSLTPFHRALSSSTAVRKNSFKFFGSPPMEGTIPMTVTFSYLKRRCLDKFKITR